LGSCKNPGGKILPLKKPPSERHSAIFDQVHSKTVERKRGGMSWGAAGCKEKLRERKGGNIDEDYEVAERKG